MLHGMCWQRQYFLTKLEKKRCNIRAKWNLFLRILQERAGHMATLLFVSREICQHFCLSKHGEGTAPCWSLRTASKRLPFTSAKACAAMEVMELERVAGQAKIQDAGDALRLKLQQHLLFQWSLLLSVDNHGFLWKVVTKTGVPFDVHCCLVNLEPVCKCKLGEFVPSQGETSLTNTWVKPPQTTKVPNSNNFHLRLINFPWIVLTNPPNEIENLP